MGIPWIFDLPSRVVPLVLPFFDTPSTPGGLLLLRSRPSGSSPPDVAFDGFSFYNIPLEWSPWVLPLGLHPRGGYLLSLSPWVFPPFLVSPPDGSLGYITFLRMVIFKIYLIGGTPSRCSHFGLFTDGSSPWCFFRYGPLRSPFLVAFSRVSSRGRFSLELPLDIPPYGFPSWGCFPRSSFRSNPWGFSGPCFPPGFPPLFGYFPLFGSTPPWVFFLISQLRLELRTSPLSMERSNH